MLALPGNPYDGRTLTTGHGLDHRPVFISGQRRVLTPTIRPGLRRRSAIESVIGHMKTDGHLDCNFLAGTRGDAINAPSAAQFEEAVSRTLLA